MQYCASNRAALLAARLTAVCKSPRHSRTYFPAPLMGPPVRVSGLQVTNEHDSHAMPSDTSCTAIAHLQSNLHMYIWRNSIFFRCSGKCYRSTGTYCGKPGSSPQSSAARCLHTPGRNLRGGQAISACDEGNLNLQNGGNLNLQFGSCHLYTNHDA